jgi:Zn-finger protein
LALALRELGRIERTFLRWNGSKVRSCADASWVHTEKNDREANEGYENQMASNPNPVG